MQLSVVIITYNEEKNIERCLKSVLPLTDDIVVVDSFSTDSTDKICANYHVRFYQREFKGYSDQKNFANSLAKYDYIFSIDADEAVSPELAASILNAECTHSKQVFWVNRMTNYCGKWIHHCGWYPDRKERIWNRNTGMWTGHIHEKPAFNCEVHHTSIHGDLLHYSYYHIDEHYRQSEKFARMKAEDLHFNGRKSHYITLIFAPFFRFLSVFIFKLGFLDGKYGFFIAKISARATFLKHKWLLILKK